MQCQYFTRAARAGAGWPAACLVAVLAVPAIAGAEDAVLEEITVTAQKREQSELDVPMTVDVFSARDIEQTGALNLMEMQDYIPGFEMGDNPTQSAITIRGVSSVNISTGGDPSVATFYDGVYVPRAATTGSFTDLQRVEVLKGPQGTLYGRNAAAGVVHMVPNRPGPEHDGFIKSRVGNYDLFRIEGMANLPLSDTLFARVNILSNRRDGYLTNLVPGERDPGEQDNIAARISVLWQPSERTDLQVSWDADHVDNAPRPAVGLSEWSACPDDPRCDDILNDVVRGEESRAMWAANVKLNHEINDSWSTKFVTGVRSFETINKQDEDGTAEFDRYLDTDNIEDSNILYSELQFSFTNDRVNLVFGGNYSDEDVHQEIPIGTNTDSVMRAVTASLAAEFGAPFDHLWNPAEMAGLLNFLWSVGQWPFPVTPQDVVDSGDLFYEMLAPAIPGPFFGPSHAGTPWSEIYFNDGDFTNWGLYGDVDFRVSDRWNLLFGLRYSDDAKTFSWRNPPNTFTAARPGTPDLAFVPIPGYEQARTGTLVAKDGWDNVSGRAVARFQMTDSAQMFASWSTGYIAGGFDSLDVTTSDNPLRPEESESTEIGIKGNFFGERLRLQVSLFDMTVEGRKRTVDTRPPGQPNPIPRVITGDQDVQGIEIVADWAITDSLQLGFLTTTRDSDATWEPFYNASGELVTETSSDSTDTDYTVTVGWRPELGRGKLDLRVDYIFNEISEDPVFPGFYEDREELNARIAWLSEDDKWTAALWGKNLLDQKLLGGIRDISTLFGTPFTSMDPPRTWGIEVGYRF